MQLQQITNKTSHCPVAANLFYACLSCIVECLKEAGVSGMCMASGDGIVHRCHPIFADFVSDYPEQLLVTLVKNGECPTCEVPHYELSEDCNTPSANPGKCHRVVAIHSKP